MGKGLKGGFRLQRDGWIVEGSLGGLGAGGILSAEKVAAENSPRLASSLTLAVSPRRVDGLRTGTLGSEDRVGDAWGCWHIWEDLRVSALGIRQQWASDAGQQKGGLFLQGDKRKGGVVCTERDTSCWFLGSSWE